MRGVGVKEEDFETERSERGRRALRGERLRRETLSEQVAKLFHFLFISAWLCAINVDLQRRKIVDGCRRWVY